MSIRKSLFYYVFVVSFFLLTVYAQAEIIERVVAIVNDDIILLSEFKDAYRGAALSRARISEGEFLDEMINKILILQQARRFGFDASVESREFADNLIVEKYLERRIKAFIHIPFADVENYYLDNRPLFKGKSFFDVQDEIEAVLLDESLGDKISQHIKELRDNSYIRVQLHN